jgi:2,4-dienoyl-CoA reductase (NADPH2)
MIPGARTTAIDDAGLHISVGGKDVTAAGGQSWCCAPVRSPSVRCRRAWKPLQKVTLIGGADVAAELDAKRAIKQGTEVAAAL